VKFGVTFPQTEIGTDPIAIRDFAQAAEGAGFDYLVAFDHVLGAHPDRFKERDLGFASPPYLYQHQFHEPFALFSFLAGFTTKIELTTGIIILPQRQTALVAKQAAAVDLFSGGRLRLGVGIGWNFTEYEALNEDFHTRGARQEEQITVLRKLWTEELVTFEGRWHKLDRVGIAPRPARPIPIWIGSGWSDRILKRVAKFADGWMPLLPADEEGTRIIGQLRHYLKQEGRDNGSFGLQALVRIERGREADWLREAEHFRSLGATHLSMGGIDRNSPPMAALETAIRAKQFISAALQ
jgi:probable F420-dependent oxidoreductase